MLRQSLSQVSSALTVEPSYQSLNRQEKPDELAQLARKYWEVSDHCSSMLFAQPRPEILFDTSSANYHYQLWAASDVPDHHVIGRIRQAHYRVLARLNQSKLQVKNFILPVQLAKMKHIDAYSRKRIIEDLCQYFSSQTEVRNVVLEQAEIKFDDLCRILVAIASKSKVKKLFLWNVLDKCDKPFRGPLQSDTVLDDIPRIPYTYNPGGRKYLRDLEEEKKAQTYKQGPQEDEKSIGILRKKQTLASTISYLVTDYSECTSQNVSQGLHDSVVDSVELLSQIDLLEKTVTKHISDSDGNVSRENFCRLLLKELIDLMETKEHVCSQTDVGIQCIISQDFEEVVSLARDFPRRDTVESVKSQTVDVLTKTKLICCKKYLKYYENAEINLKVLQEIYILALNGLTHLTTLSINYSLLADGTGNALLSVGSVARGKLKHLELLCHLEDMPFATHQLYDDGALHNIPDLIWHTVKEDCPDLNVHIVCISMSSYDATKRFITKSMPLKSFHMENGFCPSLIFPQLTIFCTLKCLWLNHKETLEHVNITLWHSTGRIDSSLEKLIQNTNLRSFAYHGPLQLKATVNKLCDAALASPKMESFKLLVQGDPCFSNIAKELTNDLSNYYRPKFQDKSINFRLGTFNS